MITAVHTTPTGADESGTRQTAPGGYLQQACSLAAAWETLAQEYDAHVTRHENNNDLFQAWRCASRAATLRICAIDIRNLVSASPENS